MARLTLDLFILSQMSRIETRVAFLEKRPSLGAIDAIQLRFELEVLRQRGIRVAELSNNVFFSLRERLDKLCGMDGQWVKTKGDCFVLLIHDLVLEIISATDLFVPGVRFKSDICKKHRAFLLNEYYLNDLRDRFDEDLKVLSQQNNMAYKAVAFAAREFALLLELTHLKCFETRLENLKNKPLAKDLSVSEKRLAKIHVLGARVTAFSRRDISWTHKQSALSLVREILELQSQMLDDAFLQNKNPIAIERETVEKVMS